MIDSSIQHQLKKAYQCLRSIKNSRLDAELLLAHALQVSRSYLIAWPKRQLTAQEQLYLDHLLQRRLSGESVAYITGKKEFWSLLLTVTPDTLVPRPDTELLVELALKKLPAKSPQKLADLGTGSGAIALALAQERPDWEITATDYYATALDVAKNNANNLSLHNVVFYEGDWCHALPNTHYNAIISNPPYLAENDPHLITAELKYEPQHALVSGVNGFDALFQIIKQAKDYLAQGGWLLLEHGFSQAEALQQKMQDMGYKNIVTHKDLSGHPRVTLAQFYSSDS